MKISRLFVAGALMLLGSNAQAEIVNGVRQTPVKAQLQYGEAMYLYNAGAQKFFLGANDYSTRASVGESGYKVYFSKHLDESGAWDGKTVIFKDSVETKSSILMVWFDGSGNSWVDWASQADTLWTITPLDADLYRLSVGEGNTNYNPETYPGVYFGVDLALDEGTNTRCWWNLDPSVTTNAVDWYFVTVDGYKAFRAAATLKIQLDAAKARGLNVSAQEAVYLNESASPEEIETATAEVLAIIAAYEEGNVSPNDPIDKTADLIKNASYDSNSNDGWSGTAPAFQSYTNAEFYNKTYDYYQAVTGAPNGVYAVNLQAFYRAGSTADSYTNFVNGTNHHAKLYAMSGADSLTVSIANIFEGATTDMIGVGTEVTGGDGLYVPNTMQAAAAYFEAGRYTGNTLFFGVDNNEFKIGLAKTTTISTDWTLFDNWNLKYYGNSAEAYKMWMAQVIADAPNFDNLPLGTLVTEGMIEAYNNVVASYSNASTKAEVIAAINAINEEAEKVQANIDAWKEYEEAVTKGKATVASGELSGPDVEDLGDYVEFDAEDYINELALTTEELLAEIEHLNTLIDNAVKNGVSAGQDVTSMYLVNADYENGATGWEGSPTVNGPSNNKCAEKFNCTFDVYQVVKNAPVGVYTVSLQGFFRPGDNSVAYPKYQAGTLPATTSICVYVNNNTDPLMNIYDEKVNLGELYQTESLVGPAPYEDADNNLWFPNDMTNAGIAFSQGMYTSKTFGIVSKQGDELRIGIKGGLDNANQWVCWDDFKMVYEGYNAEIVKPELERILLTAEANVNKTMGKGTRELLNNAIDAANEALGNGDGEVMFQALAGLLAANDTVSASVALFEQLEAAVEELGQAYYTSEASQDTKNAALTLIETVGSGIEDGIYNDDDVAGLLLQIAEMRVKLSIPAGEASDENPLDYTNAISNPGFEKDGANSIDGWLGTEGYNFGNDETQKAALLLEFYEKTFNLYQDIVGLPNGTYEVGVSAFMRNGSTSNDATAYQNGNTVADNSAYLYAETAEGKSSTVLSLLAAGAIEDKGYSGTSTITLNGASLTVPNDMVSSKNFFTEEEKYYNSIIVKVTDGTLRIGIEKNVKNSSDWVIMDDWKLYYFGENSSKDVTPDATGIENINAGMASAASVEFFNLNGAKVNTPQKGVNIVKMTMTDGSVVVKKVVLK